MGTEIFIPVLILVGVLLVGKIAEMLIKRLPDIRYVKSEMERASDFAEWRYWRRELRALRLSLIPGISYKSALRIVHFFEKR